jgi:hypothetical protein
MAAGGRPTVASALSCETWRTLVREHALEDAAAGEVMLRFVSGAEVGGV